MQAAAYELQPLDRSERVSARDLTALHTALLRESPVVLLGQRFMEQFYYTTLVREGVLRGAVAYVGGAPAGFIVGTIESAGFMRRALRRHPLRLAGIIGVSVLGDPRRFVPLLEAWRIMRNLPEPVSSEGDVGEILSLGVLPEFRSPKFIRQTGLKISLDLVQLMLRQLEAGGARTVRVVVDEDNLEARLFYQGQGWELGEAQPGGWRKPTVEYVWRAPPSADWG